MTSIVKHALQVTIGTDEHQTRNNSKGKISMLHRMIAAGMVGDIMLVEIRFK